MVVEIVNKYSTLLLITVAYIYVYVYFNIVILRDFNIIRGGNKIKRLCGQTSNDY